MKIEARHKETTDHPDGGAIYWFDTPKGTYGIWERTERRLILGQDLSIHAYEDVAKRLLDDPWRAMKVTDEMREDAGHG